MTYHRLALLIIIFIAFVLRVWQLPDLPSGLWYDEAYNVMDARWVATTENYPIFFVGNNGREPMWHYLLLLSTTFFGNTTFAVRWVGALAGVLTIPITYQFARLFLHPFIENSAQRRWFALTAAAWIAVSWWHLLNSRAGFRPILLPPLLMLSLYFFWRGFNVPHPNPLPKGEGAKHTSLQGKHSRTLTFVLSGLFLGLAQYTYLPARLMPLIFGGIIIVWIIVSITSNKNQSSSFTIHNPQFTIYNLLSASFITAIIAALTFLPLGLFFLNNPDAFSSRTGDVLFSPDNLSEFVAHLGEAAMLFLGAGHELYRHHLPGRAMLGWLELPFFWFGLIFLLSSKSLRFPETHLILLSFIVMWLPALLASPPVHALRPIGLLPAYYLIVTLGVYQLAQWVFRTLPHHRSLTTSHYTLILVPIILTLFINSYDYFVRWANHPETYQEFNGPLVDLTEELLARTETQDVIIPLHFYLHPTTRYLLHERFPEQKNQSPALERPLEMLLVPDTFQLLYVGNIPQSSAMVLLTKDGVGRGGAYVSRPPRFEEQLSIIEMLAEVSLQPFDDKLNRSIAHFVSIPDNKTLITNLFTLDALRTIELTWANTIRLNGYDITPAVAQPGETITLNFYWQSLTNKTFEYKLFIQLIDINGQPFNQWEEDGVTEDMYRWRPDGLLPTQHQLTLSDSIASGVYLIRLGFFDPLTGDRLPLTPNPTNSPDTANQIQLGLFQVGSDNVESEPTIPHHVNFADFIKLEGVTIPEIENDLLMVGATQLSVLYHWHTIQPTLSPQTIFLQLLNEQGEVISGWDSKPFNGLYSTNLWSSNEQLSDTIKLPLPEAGLSPGTYRLITGFYDFETSQRLPIVDGEDFTTLVNFEVR